MDHRENTIPLLLYQCCVPVCCCGNVFTELLPRNSSGISVYLVVVAQQRLYMLQYGCHLPCWADLVTSFPVKILASADFDGFMNNSTDAMIGLFHFLQSSTQHYRHEKGSLNPEDGDSKDLQNVSNTANLCMLPSLKNRLSINTTYC
jgi:hypothetical protein